MINKIKFLPAFFLLLYTVAFSQSLDSLKIFPGKAGMDTLKTVKKVDTAKTVRKDTLVSVDSLKTKSPSKPDSLIPVYQRPVDSQSFIINKREINFLDHRYTGSLLQYFNFYFVNDLGSIGQPNEIFIYGTGSNGISYLKDGILLNNRLQNTFDVNETQSEDIDSIEVIPLPRGFLYGINNNPVSVNLISKDFVPAKPYSRIKYYQGPNGEAMVDGIFNERAFNKFDLSFDITNRKLDSDYVNTSFSSWLVKTKIKYFLNDKINLSGSYEFEKTSIGLNGGVNVDSILSMTPDINSDLYDNTLAPVNFPYDNQGYKTHYFNLRMLARFNEDSFTDLNFYYKFDYTELDQPRDSTHLNAKDKAKIYGLALRHDYKMDLFNFQFNGNFEAGNIKYSTLTDSIFNYYPVNYTNISASIVASADLLDSNLIPSVFYKILNESGNNYTPGSNGTFSGFGADVSYRYSDLLKFYSGYSTFKNSAAAKYSQNFEIGMTSNYEDLFIDLKFFERNNFLLNNPFPFLNYTDNYTPDLTGIGANINYTYRKFSVETQTSYYSSNNSSELLYLFPKITFRGGLYYKNILFSNNLDLKTGIVYSYIGKRNSSFGEINSNWKIDFTMVGEIQKVAMVYFTWENLFDNTYYIVPYYPMYRRGIRFGISWELFN